jgi:tetratricopeptide (TPR) repeat protein
MPLSGPEGQLGAAMDPAQDEVVDTSLLTAAVLAAADAAEVSDDWFRPAPAGHRSASNTASPGVDEARRLAEHGQWDEAVALLRKIIDEAQGLLNEVAVMPRAPKPPSSRSLHRARTFLQGRRFDEAVGASHLAWQQEPTRPEVFEAMIDIHCAAAMASTDVEHFADADRWLRCAYGHDPSDARVRGLLAERTYSHAHELNALGRLGEAVQALEQGLEWNPDHRPTQELLHRLSRRSPVHFRDATGARDEA